MSKCLNRLPVKEMLDKIDLKLIRDGAQTVTTIPVSFYFPLGACDQQLI